MSELETGTAAAASPAEAIAETPAVETPAPEAAEAPAQEAPAASLDDDLKAVWDKAHQPPRERDESGRFVGKNSVEPPEAPATTEVQPPEAQGTETAPPSIQAPHSWTAEMKAKWATLPPDAQEYIARRESEATRQISRMGEQVKALQPVAETLERNRASFERNGMDFAQGVQALLNAQTMLEQNPVAAIQHLANAYGVDLARLYGGQGGTSESQPQIAALNAQIANLQRQLQETSQRVMTREQREAEAQRASLESVVDEFVRDKPDFDQIEADVMALIPAIRAQKPGLSPRELLSEAYDKASWANPEARARRLEAEKARAAQEAQQRAAQAKKVGSLNVKSSQSSASDRRTLDDELREIARKRYG